MAAKPKDDLEGIDKPVVVQIAVGLHGGAYLLMSNGAIYERVNNPEPKMSAEYEQFVWKLIPGPKV